MVLSDIFLQDLFAEDAEKAAGGCTSNAMEEDWPSEDSEDDDYDPERAKVIKDNKDDKDEDDEEKKLADSLDSSSDSGSESEATSGSAASSDDDSDNSLVSGDELAHQGKRRQRKDGEGRTPVNEDVDANTQDHANILAAEEEEVAAVSGKRQRKPVDYKKLHDVSVEFLLLIVKSESCSMVFVLFLISPSSSSH